MPVDAMVWGPKYLQLADKYERLIRDGSLPSDSFMPSQAALIRTERLALGTIRQALKELEKRGLVRAEHGRGVRVLPFTSGSRLGKRRLMRIGVAILDPEADASVYLDVVKGVSDEITPLGGGVILYRPNGHSADDALEGFFRQSDGVIMMGKLEHRQMMFAKGSGKPYLIAGHAVELRDELACSAVTLDVESAAGLVVQSLQGFGHRRIALCVNDVLTTYQQGLIHGFEMQCGRSSMQCQSMVAARLADGFSSILDVVGGARPPTAVIVDHFGVGRWLCETLRERGLRVPGDISVAAVGNSLDAQAGEPSVAGASFDLEGLGRLAARSLAREPELIHISFPPAFIVGQTLGPAREVASFEAYHCPAAVQELS